MRKSKRRKFRDRMFIKDPFCYWCGEWMILYNHQDHGEMATIEHLVPRSAGGSDKPENLRLVHKRCNK